MPTLESFLKSAKAHLKRVVFPEGDDPRILQAAQQLSSEGVAHPILLGDRTTLEPLAKAQGVSLAGLEVIYKFCTRLSV